MAGHEEWKEACRNPFQASRETKLQSLQYKIIHRIFPCGSYLCRIRIRDWCKYCDQTDSISHHLFRCDKVKPFWNWILLAVKFFIFRQKLFHEGELSLCLWLGEFKVKLQTETWIRKRTGSRPVNTLCNRILEALG